MKRFLLIIFIVFILCGCIVIEKTKNFIPIENDIFKYDKYEIKNKISDYNFRCFIHFGFFRSDFSWYSPSKINLYAFGFNNINDIEIDNYVIKKNKKIIKKKIKFEKIFYYYLGDQNKPVVLLTSKNSIHCKNKDLLEIIFDLSINIDGEIINKKIKGKWEVNKEFGIGLPME